MKKSILNLKGAQVLTNAEQKNVTGGVGEGCKWITYLGANLAACRVEYPNASYFNGKCRAYVCGF